MKNPPQKNDHGQTNRQRQLAVILERREKNKRSLFHKLLATGALGAGMVLLLYLFLGVWPAGDGTVLTGDLNSQYINYFAHYRRAFFSGTGFDYSFGKSLGGGLMGLFAYYVSSPLNLLYLLVPERWFPVLSSVLLGAKVVLASVLCCYFLEKKFPETQQKAGMEQWSIILGLCYGFASYSFVYAQNIMWHDVVVLLPLVCHGIDRMVAGGNNTRYIGALALAIFANFYIAYMVCIFAVLYLLWSLLAAGRRGLAKGIWKPVRSFALGSLLAGGVCAALLLPALQNINATKGALGQLELSFSTQFSLRQLPEQLVFGSFRLPDAESGLPLLYCGTLALLLAVCYFVSRHTPLREKLCSAGLVLLLLASMWLSPLDVLWHGGKEPVWFPYRYSFLFCFVLVLLGASVIARRGLGQRTLALSAAILAAGFALVALFPMNVGRKRPLLTLALVLGCAACFWLMSTGWGRRLRRPLVAAVMLATLLELTANSFLITNQFEKYPLSTYQAFYDNGAATVKAIQARDTEGIVQPHRIEKTFFRSLNDPMLLDYRGVSHFGSTQDTPAVDALIDLGFNAYNGCGPYLYGSTAFADSVLGVKYVFSDGSRPVPPHLELEEMNTPYEVYRNNNAMPMLFGVGEPASNEEAEPLANFGLAWQQELYNALGGEGTLYHKAEAAIQTAGESTKLPEGPGVLPAGSTIEITAGRDGWYYAQMNAAMLDVNYALDGEMAGGYLTADHAGPVQLGYLEKGEKVALSFTAKTPEGPGDIPYDAIGFFSLETGTVETLAEKAREASGEFTIQNGRVTGNLSAGEGVTTLFTTIPWDAQWEATVNGEEVTPAAFAGRFLSVPLKSGANKIELRYVSTGIAPGIALSAACLAVYIGLVLWRRRKPKTTIDTEETI